MQVRFGMWDRALAWPPPRRFERGPGDPGGHAHAQGVWHFAHGMAFASKAQQAQHGAFLRAAQAYRRDAEEQAALLEKVAKAAPRDLHTRPGQGVGIYSPGVLPLPPVGCLSIASLCQTVCHNAGAQLGMQAQQLRADHALPAGLLHGSHAHLPGTACAISRMQATTICQPLPSRCWRPGWRC